MYVFGMPWVLRLTRSLQVFRELAKHPRQLGHMGFNSRTIYTRGPSRRDKEPSVPGARP